MSLIFSNSPFAGGFGPNAAFDDFRRNCELNPHISKTFFNWQKYTNLIKLKKWPLIFLSYITFFSTLFSYNQNGNLPLWAILHSQKLFLQKRYVFYKSRREFMSFCEVHFLRSQWKKIPSTTPLKFFFSYLLSIHHVISILCTVLLSSHLIQQDLFLSFRGTRSSRSFPGPVSLYPHTVSLLITTTQAFWVRHHPAYSHAARHNGHLIYA